MNINSNSLSNLIFEQKAYKKRFKNINLEKFPVSKKLKRKILTLPINQFLSSKQVKNICKEIKKFF